MTSQHRNSMSPTSIKGNPALPKMRPEKGHLAIHPSKNKEMPDVKQAWELSTVQRLSKQQWSRAFSPSLVPDESCCNFYFLVSTQRIMGYGRQNMGAGRIIKSSQREKTYILPPTPLMQDSLKTYIIITPRGQTLLFPLYRGVN